MNVEIANFYESLYKKANDVEVLKLRSEIYCK